MQGECNERDELSDNERTERFDCEWSVRDNYAGTKLAERKGSEFLKLTKTQILLVKSGV